jgi:hypothetical protein
MDILHSNWLIHMLEKSSTSAYARLLSLFDILHDWSDAPGISLQTEDDYTFQDANALKAYLSLEAAKAGAALPEMLATQLYFMALSALQEKLLNNNYSGLIHAKSAAEALIKAQTKKEFRISRQTAYAIAASFVGTIIITSGLFFHYSNPKTAINTVRTAHESAFKPVLNPVLATPESTAALVAQIELMRSGNCRLLEAIQLPDEYKSIYFKNIVLGQITTDPQEQKLVRELLEKIRCNYTPMLMKKST